jgi:ribonuclease T
VPAQTREATPESRPRTALAGRFRGLLPVVVDVETGGFNAHTDALLELAAVTVEFDARGHLHPAAMHAFHIKPFPGARLEAASLAVNGIDPYHPFRLAVTEKEALETLFAALRQEIDRQACNRAILVGHNPSFDLAFLKAAAARAGVRDNPFHGFSTLDTATLGALAFGQTVLARAARAAGLDWDSQEAHSARYDAQGTAKLFCEVVNRWEPLRQVDASR